LDGSPTNAGPEFSCPIRVRVTASGKLQLLVNHSKNIMTLLKIGFSYEKPLKVKANSFV